MSPVPDDSSSRFIIRKDSCESSSSMDSLDAKKSYLQIPVDGDYEISDQYYQSYSDSDHQTELIADTAKEDSGVEADQGGVDFIPPDKELSDKIIQQVEFYFSDANITKDAFLLKHVRRNKEGYVSLKLIASFKRVKHISKDWQVVAHALKGSTKLQINDSGTKIRRIEPLPIYDETTPSRTVIAMNLPSEKPTVEGVAEVFRKCGEIALIRILRPGNPIPNDVKQFVNKHAELGNSVCALVEFEASESARKAVNLMNNSDNWRSMQVYELARPAGKKTGKKTQNKKPEPEKQPNKPSRQHLSSESSDNPPEDRKRQRSRKKKTNKPENFRRDSGSDRSENDSPSHIHNNPTLSSSPTFQRYLPPRSSPIPSPDSNRRQKNSSICESSSPQNIWTPRRRSNSALTTLSSSLSNRRTSDINNTLSTSPNVIRMPRGPDGSKGFHFGRLRSVSAPVSLPVPPVLTICY